MNAHTSERRLCLLAWALFAIEVAFFALSVMLDTLNGGVRSNLEPSPLEAPVYLAFPIVGVVLATRRPRLPFGWMMMIIGFFFLNPLPAYARYASVTRGGELPGAELAIALVSPMWIVFVGLSAFMLLLFPDGHLPSRRWRWFAWAGGAGLLLLYVATLVGPSVSGDYELPGLENPFRVPGTEWLGVTFLAVPLMVVGGAVAMIVRLRRVTDPVQRQQLRLLAWGAGVIAVVYVGALVPTAFGFERNSDPNNVLGIVAAASFTLIPITIGIAIMRFRLYDLDIVISKTIVYGAMAAFITAVYVAIAVGVGELLGGTRDVTLSIVATAVVAVAFQPVRERVQRFANRLVYGSRAAPYDVLSHLSGRVTGMFETEDVLPRLARLLLEGTGATRVEIWLHVADRLRLTAAWPHADVDASRWIPVGGAELPTIADASAVSPVRDGGELLGALAVHKAPGDPLTPPDRALIDDVARQAALLLRNVRLIEELRASRERIVSAEDDERRRLERDIHDGAQQQIVALTEATRRAGTSVDAEAPAPLKDLLDRAVEESTAALAEIRELARGIHPRVLAERGLAAAIRTLAARSPVPVTVEDEMDARLPEAVEATAYFAVSEALANVAKYANATRAVVATSRDDGTLVVAVTDDGVGGADPAKGSGLRGLLDRIDAVGGHLSVESPPGKGTRLTVTLPAVGSPASSSGSSRATG
jgi:signal transduction histidine kinase